MNRETEPLPAPLEGLLTRTQLNEMLQLEAMTRPSRAKAVVAQI